jgi:hypothetical protein
MMRRLVGKGSRPPSASGAFRCRLGSFRASRRYRTSITLDLANAGGSHGQPWPRVGENRIGKRRSPRNRRRRNPAARPFRFPSRLRALRTGAVARAGTGSSITTAGSGEVLTCAKRLVSARSSSPCFADDASYLSVRWAEIPLSLTWVLTGLRPEVFERAGAAQISGPSLPRRCDLQYPCRLLPWPAEVRVGAPFSRPRLAVKGCWP